MMIMTDADLDRYWNIAVRDDWHRRLVASDIRILIREIRSCRAELAKRTASAVSSTEHNPIEIVEGSQS